MRGQAGASRGAAARRQAAGCWLTMGTALWRPRRGKESAERNCRKKTRAVIDHWRSSASASAHASAMRRGCEKDLGWIKQCPLDEGDADELALLERLGEPAFLAWLRVHNPPQVFHEPPPRVVAVPAEAEAQAFAYWRELGEPANFVWRGLVDGRTVYIIGVRGWRTVEQPAQRGHAALHRGSLVAAHAAHASRIVDRPPDALSASLHALRPARTHGRSCGAAWVVGAAQGDACACRCCHVRSRALWQHQAPLHPSTPQAMPSGSCSTRRRRWGGTG